MAARRLTCRRCAPVLSTRWPPPTPISAADARTALVVGAEIFSRILDWNDRTTCVLFGDGAGAAVLTASEEPGILGVELTPTAATSRC